MKKRIFSTLLALLLCISFTAMAENTVTEDNTAVSNAELIYSFDATNAGAGTRLGNENYSYTDSVSGKIIRSTKSVTGPTALGNFTYSDKGVLRTGGRFYLGTEDNDAVYSLLTTKPFTYSAWVYIDPEKITGTNKQFSLLQTQNGGILAYVRMTRSDLSDSDTSTTGYIAMKATYENEEGTSNGRGWKIADCFEAGQWNHVAITYDPTSDRNKPNVYLNGVSLTVPDWFGTAADYTSLVAEGGNVLIGTCVDGGTGYPNGQSTFNDIKFYEGMMTASETYELYTSELSEYGNRVDIKVYDETDTMYEDLSKLNLTGNKITIDFRGTSYDPTTIYDMVTISDKTENKQVEYDYSWDGDVLTVSDFTLISEHKYEVCVNKDYIQNADATPYRLTDEVVSFKADKVTPLELKAEFNFDNATADNSNYVYNFKNGLQLKVGTQGNNLAVDTVYTTSFTKGIARTTRDSAHGWIYPTATESNKVINSVIDGEYSVNFWVKPSAWEVAGTNTRPYPLYGAYYNVTTDKEGTSTTSKVLDTILCANNANTTLTFEKTFINEAGETYRNVWTTDAVPETIAGTSPRWTGKWYNIALSYNPDDSESLPVIVINGHVCTVTANSANKYQTDGYYPLTTSTYSERVIGLGHLDKINCNSAAAGGTKIYGDAVHYIKNSSSAAVTKTQWGDIRFYSGSMKASDMVTKYNVEKVYYEDKLAIKNITTSDNTHTFYISNETATDETVYVFKAVYGTNGKLITSESELFTSYPVTAGNTQSVSVTFTDSDSIGSAKVIVMDSNLKPLFNTINLK